MDPIDHETNFIEKTKGLELVVVKNNVTRVDGCALTKGLELVVQISKQKGLDVWFM